MTIDGVARKILGPYKASSGYNYEGVFSGLAAGSHTYIIRAVDTAGNASQYSGHVCCVVVASTSACSPATAC